MNYISLASRVSLCYRSPRYGTKREAEPEAEARRVGHGNFVDLFTQWFKL